MRFLPSILALATAIGSSACDAPAPGPTGAAAGVVVGDAQEETAVLDIGASGDVDSSAASEAGTPSTVDCGQVLLRVSAAGFPAKLLFVKFAGADGKPNEKTVQLVHGGTVPTRLVKASLESAASFEFRVGQVDWQGPGATALRGCESIDSSL